ncbi:hypothetical protein IPA_00970 [Ignicoccus pacificus DSM 13166]|uniref:Uncharacterized protein n=1 Tax=Ignicoccus pacificus DSM 13166 TaxID=940294 RepID=A0A977KCD1_9CREN|nr:hypothetical protein IPA_00970 [Ignicoccus pacificus DSM 13166]
MSAITARVKKVEFEEMEKVLSDHFLEYILWDRRRRLRASRSIFLLGSIGIGKNGVVRSALKNVIRGMVSFVKEVKGEVPPHVRRYATCITQECQITKLKLMRRKDDAKIMRMVEGILDALDLSNCPECQEVSDEGILIFTSSLDLELYKNRIVLVEHAIPSSTPEELTGLRDLSKDYSKQSPPEWAVALRHARFGVLVLNDINYKCPEAVRLALNSISNEKRAGEYEFDKPVVLTANIEEDLDEYIESIQLALANRAEIYHMTPPKILTWMKYMNSTHRDNWLTSIGSFLLLTSSYGIFQDDRYIDDVFVSIPDENSLQAPTLRNFPTPRSWETVACHAKEYKEDYEYFLNIGNSRFACGELKKLNERAYSLLGSESLALSVVALVSSRRLNDALFRSGISRVARVGRWEIEDAMQLINGIIDFIEHLDDEIPCHIIPPGGKNLLISVLIINPFHRALNVLEKKLDPIKSSGRPSDLCRKIITLLENGEPATTFLSSLLRALQRDGEVVIDIKDQIVDEIKRRLSREPEEEEKLLPCLLSGP